MKLELGARITAKVLWWDRRDGYGVVVDDAGNEFYIDASVCRALPGSAPLENQLIRGVVGLIQPGCTALRDVTDFLGANK